MLTWVPEPKLALISMNIFGSNADKEVIETRICGRSVDPQLIRIRLCGIRVDQERVKKGAYDTDVEG